MKDFFVTYKMANKEDRDGYLNEALAIGVAEKSLAEDGCYKYQYFTPVGSDNSLFLWEVWETAEHQAAHKETEHFKQLGKLKEKYNVTTEILVYDRA